MLDIIPNRVDKINRKESPIDDDEIKFYLENVPLNLEASLVDPKAYISADVVIIATPTDYNEDSNSFNTSSVESVIVDVLKVNQQALIVIKSTIPVGFTLDARLRFGIENIIFSPEFLREGWFLVISSGIGGGA